MIGRIIASVFAVLAYGWINAILHPVSVLITSRLAGKQLENSDSSYIVSTVGMNFFQNLGIPFVVLLLVLMAIWWKPVAKLIKENDSASIIMIAAISMALLLGTTDGHAFFEKTERTEVYPVLPNYSAFYVPGQGANKDTQVQMDTEQYYNANKVSAKYFKVDHQLLKDSAGKSMFSGADYYVNTGFFILLDRSRFTREWVDAHDRGTSVRKEGFPCQAKGDEKNPTGLNITVGMSIGAYVTEANAAKFLYNFGVKTPTGSDGKALQVKGDLANIENDGKIIYQSVYYARSLVEVMDDVGRKRIGTLVCSEIAKRTFDKANNEMTEILTKVTTDAKTYFDSVGITLDFLGYADTWGFDKEIQDSLNRHYSAIQDEQIAKLLQPYTETIKALASAQAQRNFGEKSDGKLPTTYLGMPPEVIGQLLGTSLKSGVVQGSSVPATSAAPMSAPLK